MREGHFSATSCYGGLVVAGSSVTAKRIAGSLNKFTAELQDGWPRWKTGGSQDPVLVASPGVRWPP